MGLGDILLRNHTVHDLGSGRNVIDCNSHIVFAADFNV